MAKKSILERNKKREIAYKAYRDKREEIKFLIKKSRTSAEDKALVLQRVLQLDKMKRNSSITRKRNRCMLTGRARGLVSFNYFGLCGIQLRYQSNRGNIPGIRKI